MKRPLTFLLFLITVSSFLSANKKLSSYNLKKAVINCVGTYYGESSTQGVTTKETLILKEDTSSSQHISQVLANKKNGLKTTLYDKVKTGKWKVENDTLIILHENQTQSSYRIKRNKLIKIILPGSMVTVLKRK